MKKNISTLILAGALLCLPAMAENQNTSETCLDSIENVKSCIKELCKQSCLSGDFIHNVFENLTCGNAQTGWNDLISGLLPELAPPSVQKPDTKPESSPELSPDIQAPSQPEKPQAPQAPQDTPNNNQSSNSSFVKEILRLVNIERQKAGLSSVLENSRLDSAALVRAKEIPQLFSHTRPNGQSCFSVLSDMGISYSGAGENIAMGQTSPAQVMNEWMNSSGHKANILNPSFKNLGVGVYKSGSKYYWAQMFTY